jgi:hypothetical protein
MRRAVGAVCLIVALCAPPTFAEDREVKLLQKYKDWAAYTATGSPKVCFAVSQPKDSSPKNVRRGPIYFYVAHYPEDKVTGEVSVKMGYPFAPGGKATVTVDGKKFELFTKEEGAFVEKTSDEASLVNAMEAGNSMKVEGRSARGTDTSDTYSLSGVTDAIERIDKECSG